MAVATMTAIGISMGTRYVMAGLMSQGQAAILYHDDDHAFDMPACVAFTDTDVLVGTKAYDQMEENPENTIFDCKRLLGRFYDDPEIQDYLKEWPFKIIDDQNRPKYKVQYKEETTTFFPEEIVGFLFKAMRERGQFATHLPVTEAVIAVPAQFNHSQRQATMDAASLAGFTVLGLINESIAAVIAYNIAGPHVDQPLGDKSIAMISAGSGFLDVCIVTYDARVYECKGTRGSSKVDTTRALLNHFAKKFKDKHEVDVFKDPYAYVCLMKACRQAEKEMALQNEAVVEIEYNGKILYEVLRRHVYDDLTFSISSQVRELFERCLSDTGYTKDSLHECLMVGGSCHIPRVQDTFSEIASSVNFHSVLETPEVYAVLGAEIVAASLKGENGLGLQDLVKLEISPQTVGILTPEGKCRPFVRQNANIPHWSTQTYTTRYNHQSSIPIEVYEGDNKLPAQNKLLGMYHITGFPLEKRGVPTIVVTLKVDPNGILTCFAEDRTKDSDGTEIEVVNELGTLSREEANLLRIKFTERFPPKPVPELQPPPDLPPLGGDNDDDDIPEAQVNGGPPPHENDNDGAPDGANGGAPDGANGGAPIGADGGAPNGVNGGAPIGANGGAPIGANGGAPIDADGGAPNGADGGAPNGADGGAPNGANGGAAAENDGQEPNGPEH